MNKKQKFWTCVIGPADENILPPGADSPMRIAVQTAFLGTTGDQHKICMSGWGSDSETAAESSVQRDFVYAVDDLNSPEPQLRKLTSGELLKLITGFAKEYHSKSVESVKRKNHMNDLTEKDEVSQKVVDAVLADFVNYIGSTRGVDYGLYASDLK
jgi:hypothetical protein